MDNKVKNSNKELNSTIKLVISAAIVFACVLAYVPEAGILRTIPFLLVAGIVCGIIGTKPAATVALSGMFSLSVYLVRGSGVAEAVVYTALAAVLTASGIYAVKLCSIARRTQKKNVRTKCIVICAAAVVVSLVLSVVMCGNPVSFFVGDSDNTSHIVFVNKHLGADSVKKEYTSYDALDGEYKTFVTFKDGDNIIGTENDCYVSFKNDKLVDNVRDYYEDKMLVNAERVLSGAVVEVTSAFEITASDIAFDNDELVLPDADYTSYASRIGYVVSFYSILDDEQDFLSLCEDVVKQLEKTELEFKEIVFCGGTASDVLYAAQLLPGMDYNTMMSKYCDGFDGFKHVNLEEEYGVTEERILDYWNNK